MAGSAEDLEHAKQGVGWDTQHSSPHGNDTLNIRGTAADGVNNGINGVTGLLPAFQRLPRAVIELYVRSNSNPHLHGSFKHTALDNLLISSNT